MTDDNLDDTQKAKAAAFYTFKPKLNNSVGKQDNVYARAIWNEAIEAAINICMEYGTVIKVKEQIRKLKK
jgi:hypothetical protein